MSWSNSLLWIYIYGLSLTINAIQPQSDFTDPRIIEHPEDQYVAKNEPATLNCKAEGNPQPVISWYKDGQLVTTSHENPSSHRMLLPSGQLFFLRIIHNKSQRPDIGVYYCNATNPETRVSVVSRNATLEIAVIRDEFRVQPRNTEVAIGDTAVLDCRGPKGLPEPRLSWKKDGKTIKPAELPRFTVQDTGSLMIQNTRKEDTGIYVCISTNIADEKESDPARLLVLEKPQFKKAPEDSTAKVGQVVQFPCQASGDPAPTILWRKDGGIMPQGRSEVLSNKSLKIENVRISDEGTYICRAENSVGYEEASAKLTVHSPPSFVVTPRDKTVGVGRRVSFRCEVVGNPAPSIFWNKEGGTIMFFPHQEHSRVKVMADGTLIIEPVEIEDQGNFICQGLSPAGSAFSKAHLDVKDIDPRPPPIIHQGPQNQTLPTSSVAMLPCSSSGDPQPIISWIKSNRQLTMNDPRITQLASGTLQISDLKTSDAGLYTCQATSETGETVWSAALAVEAPTNQQVIFHRTPEPTTFPGPPSKPQVESVGEHQIALSWKANPNHGASPVFSYTVEYFSHQTGEGWIVASDNIREQTFTVQNLEASTSYLFLVRAQNSHGLSLPSRVTEPITTKGRGGSMTKGDVSEDIARAVLSGATTELLTPRVISSTAVQLQWKVRKSAKDYIEGYHIKFRVKPEDDQYLHNTDAANSNSRVGERHHHHHVEFTIITVLGSGENSYMLRDLNKYTWYEIRVQPFYHTVEGAESNTESVKTMEDLPAAPPQNVRTHIYENGTAQIVWDPPPRHLHNGLIQGYKVFLYGNETRFNRIVRTNQTTVFMPDMKKGIDYRVQVLAYNRIGDGIKTAQVIVGEDVSVSLMKEKWFIATMVGIGAAALFFLLCLFSIWLHLKKNSRKKEALTYTKNGILSVPVNLKAEESTRNVQSYFSALNAPNYLQKDIANHVQSVQQQQLQQQQQQQLNMHQQPDVTNVGSSAPPSEHNMSSAEENYYNTPSSLQPMKTFYNKNQPMPAGPVSPYATTTLLQNSSVAVAPPTVNSAFRPIQPTTGSNESCGKEMTSSDSNNETRSNAGRLSNHSTPLLPHRRLGPPQHHTPRHTPRHTPAVSRRTTPKMMQKIYDSSREHFDDSSCQELLPQCEQCGDHINSPMSDCESMMTEYDDPARYYMGGNPPPMLFLPPPPEHPPPSDTEGGPGDYHSARRMMHHHHHHHPPPQHMGGYAPGRGGVPPYHSNTTGGSRDSPHGIRNSPRDNSGVYSDSEQFRGANPYGSCGHYPTGQYGNHPRTNSHDGSGGNYNSNPHQQQPINNGQHFRTMSPTSLPQGGMVGAVGTGGGVPPNSNSSRAYSPRAMSEPDRGPTPPIRAYKLVPIRDPNEAQQQRHYSDTEGAPVPPLRMMVPHMEEPPSPAPQDDYGQHELGLGMDRGIQSSLPSLASEFIGGVDGNSRAGESPSSEVGNFESDMEGGRMTPESSVGDPNDPDVTASAATWGSGHDSDNNSSHSSVVTSSDESFLAAEADFASAVAKAAEMSGLTVVGSTVSDPKAGKDQVKKFKKPRERANRPSSPYSTDSNYSSITPRKPYPKSDRRRQMKDRSNNSSSNNASQDEGGNIVKTVSPPGGKPPPLKAKPQLPQNMADLPSYNKPSFPSSGGASPRSPPSSSGAGHMNVRTNPLAAFDTTDTPIV